MAHKFYHQLRRIFREHGCCIMHVLPFRPYDISLCSVLQAEREVHMLRNLLITGEFKGLAGRVHQPELYLIAGIERVASAICREFEFETAVRGQRNSLL